VNMITAVLKSKCLNLRIRLSCFLLLTYGLGTTIGVGFSYYNKRQILNGVVRHRGETVQFVQVLLVPVDDVGLCAHTWTNEQGLFCLNAMEDGSRGVRPGEYRMYFLAPRYGVGPRRSVPVKYQDIETSGIVVKISWWSTQRQHEFNLD